jgi:DNA-binding Lrp family transcriptional regulator
MSELPSVWTFLSNHGHVLVALAADPQARMRDVAERVGITERAVQLIVRDLQQAGYLDIRRVGRRNTYTVVTTLPLRHPLEQHARIGDLLEVLLRPDAANP